MNCLQVFWASEQSCEDSELMALFVHVSVCSSHCIASHRIASHRIASHSIKFHLIASCLILRKPTSNTFLKMRQQVHHLVGSSTCSFGQDPASAHPAWPPPLLVAPRSAPSAPQMTAAAPGHIQTKIRPAFGRCFCALVYAAGNCLQKQGLHACGEGTP